MGSYESLSWEKPGFFRETHYLRKSSGGETNLFFRCDVLFESVWFPAYQPPHYALPQTLYELILEGSYCHMDREHMVTELHEGDWIITRMDRQPPGHYDKVLRAPLRRIGLLVAPTPVHEAVSQLLFPENRAALHTGNTAPFQKLLDAMKTEMKTAGDEEKISLLMAEVIQKIAALRNRQNSSRRFAEILQECHAASWRTPAELAERFAMSERTLTRLFQANLETSPGRYLAEVRLEKARSLLSVPDLEIKEIARLCGYGSANFLTRCFRLRYQVTPREYRAGKRSRQLISPEQDRTAVPSERRNSAVPAAEL